jgi:hypothetical protein
MPAPTVQELNDAKVDLDDLESIVNGDASTTVTTRLGGDKPSVSRALSEATAFRSVADYTALASLLASGNSLVGASITVLSPSGPPFEVKQGIATDDGGVIITQNRGTTAASQFYAERIFSGAVSASWHEISASSSNNSPAWQNLLSSNPPHVHFPDAGSYTFLSSTSHSASINITAAPGVIIDCTDAAYSGGSWTSFTGAFPQIENLGSNATKGARSVSFASAPSLSPGDVFVIYNPTNSSWSGFRTNYFAGEFCQVVSVSGSTVTVAGELYDSYNTADVDVYRLDAINVSIDGLTVSGDRSESLIDLEFCRDSLIENITCNHKNNSCITLTRSYNCAVREASIFNEGDGGDDYGIAVTNSQTIRIDGGAIHSRRHAITTGGDASAGAVPCRDLIFSNATLSNDISSGTHCADFHGNTEASRYVNCTIYGGATWQGKNNGYVNCRIGHLLAGPCILGSEVVGGRLYANDCDFYSTIDPSATSRALIDVGGNSAAVNSNTVEDCTFEITNCTVEGENFSAITSIANMRNRGTNSKINYMIDGLRINVNDLGQILFTSDDGTGTADSDFIIVDNIVSNGAITGKLLCNHSGSAYLNFPHRLQKQSGREQVTTSTGSPTAAGTAVSFRWAYPRNPVVCMSRTNRGYAGNRVGIAYADPASTTGLTPAVSTDDSTNFSSATTIDLNWHVGIDEV